MSTSRKCVIVRLLYRHNVVCRLIGSRAEMEDFVLDAVFAARRINNASSTQIVRRPDRHQLMLILDRGNPVLLCVLFDRLLLDAVTAYQFSCRSLRSLYASSTCVLILV